MVVPYYTRTIEEVQAGASSLATLETREIVSFRTRLTSAGEPRLTTKADLEAVTGMFWAIHGPTVEAQLREEDVDDVSRSAGSDSEGGFQAFDPPPSSTDKEGALQSTMARLRDVFREQFWDAFRDREVANTMIRLWMTKRAKPG